MLGGQFADAKTLENINRDLGLDRPLGSRYLLYLNDLSIISWHQTKDSNASNFLSEEKYSYVTLIPTGGGKLVLKFPYLRRSYQTKKNVSTILADAIPGTAIIALVAIIIAFVAGVGPPARPRRQQVGHRSVYPVHFGNRNEWAILLCRHHFCLAGWFPVVECFTCTSDTSICNDIMVNSNLALFKAER